MQRRKAPVRWFAELARAQLLGDRYLLLRPVDRLAEARLEDALATRLFRLFGTEAVSNPTMDECEAAAAIEAAADEMMETIPTVEGVQVVVLESMIRDRLVDLMTRWVGCGPWAPFSALAAPLAKEVVIQLTRWGAIRLNTTESVALLDRIAGDLWSQMTVFFAVFPRTPDVLVPDVAARTPLIQHLTGRIALSLRERPEQVTVLASDAQIRGLITPVIDGQVAMALGRLRRGPDGMTPPPPFGGGPAGGVPAEVRAWHVAPGPTPPEPDPERRERPGPSKNPGRRRN